jgi:TonB family protein
MKTDQIYSSLLYSLCLHSLVVIVTILYIMYAGHHYKVTPFVVSLVDTSSINSSQGHAEKSKEIPAPAEVKSVHTTEQDDKVTKQDINRVNEQIAALEAKRKLEKVVRLRRSIDISAAKGSRIKSSGGSTTKGTDYISLVGSKIQEKFHIPESMDKDLLSIIRIRIAINGGVAILGFEKKSGNPLFDRAVIKAINDASPLPPPPSEMEMGVRLHPN